MKYGVIGAGVLGLTVALRLAEQGHDVEVLERDVVPGGLAAGFEVAPDIWLERFYHHIFQTDTAAIRLIEEVGVGANLAWFRPVTTVMTGGRVLQLDSPASLLRFDPLPFASRLRMAAALAIIKVTPTPRLLGGFTAAHWMARVAGRRAYSVVWEPLLRAKFGEHAEGVAMAWLWARIHDRTTSLGYLHGGFHRFYRALADAVTSRGARIEYRTVVSGISRDGDSITVKVGDEGEGRHYDRVVSTLPLALTQRLTPELGADFAARHPSPAALSAHCLVLALDRPVVGAYWIGVADPGWPFLAVVEHTEMVDPAEYGGRTLLYLGAYRDPADPTGTLPMDEQIALAAPLLRAIRPDYDPAWITDSWSFNAPFAQPVVDADFERAIPAFDTPIPGLYLANMFQVYPHDRGQNYSIELAERLVDHLGHETA